jgi:LmbE family N-acetylglucosaminyl deacetylase
MQSKTPPPASGTLLGIWAHPDDEAYLSSGLMALARAAGHRVVVATATRGELGTNDPVAHPPARLAKIRERELAASLSAVDVHEHRWLNFPDGGLASADRDSAVAALAGLIDEVVPDTIVTFGPDGMTGHSDHCTVSGWVTAAWQLTGGAARLWYATVTPEFHREWGDVNARVGLWFNDAVPPCTPRHALAAQVVCEGALGASKFAALAAHRSQTHGLIALLGAETFQDWWRTEYFVDAAA